MLQRLPKTSKEQCQKKVEEVFRCLLADFTIYKRKGRKRNV